MSEDYINYNYKMPAAKSKQTAVEWLVGKLTVQNDEGEVVNAYPDWIDLTEIIEEAKQMEKGQIEDAHIEGQRVFDKYPHTEWTNNQAELYYEETYGSNE